MFVQHCIQERGFAHDEDTRAEHERESVHGSKPPPAPAVPEGLVKAAADLAGVPGGAVP